MLFRQLDLKYSSIIRVGFNSQITLNEITKRDLALFLKSSQSYNRLIQLIEFDSMSIFSTFKHLI